MTLHEVRTLARKRPDQEFALNRLYGAHVSPYLTVVCLKLGLTPDQVTIVGGLFGVLGVGLLFLPIGWWSVAGVIALQLGYVLDFSDGQVARMTGRTSAAGSYLDWLTHFYIPIGGVLAVATSVAGETGNPVVLVLGTLGALEMGAFAFSCKEHVLIALQRRDPALGRTAFFHAALQDDARATDVVAAGVGPAETPGSRGIAGRARAQSLRSLVGELLIYPGSVHLVTAAVVIDTGLWLIGVTDVPGARLVVLSTWAIAMPLHTFIAVRRNHRLIRAVEGRHAQEVDR